MEAILLRNSLRIAWSTQLTYLSCRRIRRISSSLSMCLYSRRLSVRSQPRPTQLHDLIPAEFSELTGPRCISRAREKALISANILSGWKATGLEPLTPILVLEKLPKAPTPLPLPQQTPGQSSSLDLYLLHSSPPEGTELRQANALFNAQIRDVDGVPSPAKRYAKRMTRALETTQSELVTLRKRVAEQDEVLRTRKSSKKGKRVALKGKFEFSTQEVLGIVKAAEEETAANRVVNGHVSAQLT